MEWKEFQELVKLIIPSSYSGSISFKYEDEEIVCKIGDKNFVYSHREYNETFSRFSRYTNGSTYIYNKDEIEILIDFPTNKFNFRFQDEGINISNDTIKYSIQSPSPELILAFLSSIAKDEIKYYRRLMPSRFLIQRYSENENTNISLFDMLIKSMRISASLKIVSYESVTIDELKKHANSFLFNLSYNTGAVLKLVLNTSDLSYDRSRVIRNHRLPINEIETPKLFYNSELTEQYNLALSSNDSFIQFISYYHVMEYFFDEVYNGALISSVRDILQHPGFSYKKTKEISKIIDVVQRKIRVTREGFQGSELEALELTIKTFISVEELKTALFDYDPKLINYYKTHKVSFSDGDPIDLDEPLNEKLPKKIAARIYKTRNSLVHSKSNNTRIKERGIYHPFADENELMNEIPLMQIIAENIITKSAEEI